MDEVERLASEVIRRLKGDGPAASSRAGASDEGDAGASAGDGRPGLPVTVSARHMHVARGGLDRLFGGGFQLTKLRDLGQPGEFAAEQTVTLVGPSMRPLTDVRVLGPLRTYTQVEIARSDARRLGLDPPVRRSGDLVGSEGVTVVGPDGSVVLKEGVVMATRHLHMTERDASEHGVSDGDLVRVRFSGDRALVFENVLIRVGKNMALELHLDTDDANAAGVRPPMTVKILR
jgi:putative phosphotransacetylase